MNTIFTAQTGEPILFYDDVYDISGTQEYTDRWNFFGNPSAIHWTKPPFELPYYGYDGTPGSTSPACDAVASQSQLEETGCFAGPGVGDCASGTWTVRQHAPQHCSRTGLCGLGFLGHQEFQISRAGRILKPGPSSSTF